MALPTSFDVLLFITPFFPAIIAVLVTGTDRVMPPPLPHHVDLLVTYRNELNQLLDEINTALAKLSDPALPTETAETLLWQNHAKLQRALSLSNKLSGT